MTEFDPPCDLHFWCENRDPPLWGWLCFTHGSDFSGYLTLDEAETAAGTCAFYPRRRWRRFVTVNLPDEDVT